MRRLCTTPCSHASCCAASLQVFAALVLLNKSRGATDIRLVVLRVLLEFLQIFRVVFNTSFAAWKIDSNVWAFKAIRWVLIRCAAQRSSEPSGVLAARQGTRVFTSQ
jgi:hypothetical protein